MSFHLSQRLSMRAKARLTVVENVVFYQPTGGQPTQVESLFNQLIDSEEQPYIRQLKVGHDWQPLDIGWLKDAGVRMLVIQNNEGKFSVNPTAEERAEVMSRVVEVGTRVKRLNTPGGLPIIDVPFVDIAPGTSARFTPSSAHTLFIRCLSEQPARCTIHLFPL